MSYFKIYLLFLSLIVIIPIHAMENSLSAIFLDDIKIQTKDKKIISKIVSLTYEEACHSSYISECNRLASQNFTEKITLKYDEIEYHIKRRKLERAIISQKICVYNIKKKKINITAKEISFFKKILHQPKLYDQIKHKKYIDALTVAEKLQAPLLYAELLQARLPHQALTLIIEKYRKLSGIDKIINNIVSGKLKKEEKKYNFVQLYQLVTTVIQPNIQYLLNNTTLPHIILLDMICHTPYSYSYPMHIIYHMPGYNTLELWHKNQGNFITDYFPIKKRGFYIDSFEFKV